ncbi:hypothetical protein ACWIUD_00580 [Helicobacter sp. 23-1044]
MLVVLKQIKGQIFSSLRVLAKGKSKQSKILRFTQIAESAPNLSFSRE